MNETKVTSLLELIQGPSERPFLGPTSDEDNSTYDNEVEGINEALEAVKQAKNAILMEQFRYNLYKEVKEDDTVQ